MYAKEVNGQIETIDSLKTQYPNTSFPAPMPNEFDGWKRVTTPTVPNNKRVTKTVEFVDGAPQFALRDLTSDEKAAHLAQYRYERENAGIQVGATTIQTDLGTRTNILGAVQLDGPIKWKTPAGFVSLTKAQLVSISGAIGQHVQKCFDAEATVLEDIDTYTTLQEIEDAFDTAYNS